MGLQRPHEEILVVGDIYRVNGHIEPVTGWCRGKGWQGFENLSEVQIATDVVAICVSPARHETQSVGDALAQRRRVRPVAGGLLGGRRGRLEPDDVGHQEGRHTLRVKSGARIVADPLQ